MKFEGAGEESFETIRFAVDTVTPEAARGSVLLWGLLSDARSPGYLIGVLKARVEGGIFGRAGEESFETIHFAVDTVTPEAVRGSVLLWGLLSDAKSPGYLIGVLKARVEGGIFGRAGEESFETIRFAVDMVTIEAERGSILLWGLLPNARSPGYLGGVLKGPVEGRTFGNGGEESNKGIPLRGSVGHCLRWGADGITAALRAACRYKVACTPWVGSIVASRRLWCTGWCIGIDRVHSKISQGVVELAGMRGIFFVNHVVPTDLHAFFEELRIKNVFDICSGFNNFINIDIALKINLEPFKFRLATSRPRFRVHKRISSGISLIRWDNYGPTGAR
jgi:hypothetical protein